jgi:hypothetical protein
VKETGPKVHVTATSPTFALALVLAIVVPARSVRAQEPENPNASGAASTRHRWWPPFDLAIGPGIKWQMPLDEAASNDTIIDLIMRPSPRTRAGIIPQGRMNVRPWTTAAVSGDEAGAQEFGRLRLRPFMAGLGWVQPIAPRLSAVAAGVAGYSFNSVDKGETPSGGPRLVLPDAIDRIDNSFVWEVSGRLWYDVHPRIYLMGGVSFLRTRPTLTFVSGSQASWKADYLRMETGVAFLVLRRR